MTFCETRRKRTADSDRHVLFVDTRNHRLVKVNAYNKLSKRKTDNQCGCDETGYAKALWYQIEPKMKTRCVVVPTAS